MKTETQESAEARAAGKKRWLIPAAVILAALLIGGIILAAHWPFSFRNVIQLLQQDWPGKVAAQKFRRTYFPHPGCVLENVSLARGSSASVPPVVTIQKVTIQANYHDLLLRPGYVYRIVLEGLKVSVPADQSEESSEDQRAGSPPQDSVSSNSSVRLGEVYTKDAVLEVATKSDGPLRFEIHQLRLKSITSSSPMSYDLSMRNARPPGEIHSRGKLGPWDSQHLDNVPLSGTYTFEQADLGVFDGIAGMLAATGEFYGALGRIETQGTTDTPNFQVTRSPHTVPLKTKFSATVDGTGGDTVLHSVDVLLLRTFLHVTGSVASKPGQPGKTTALSVTARDGHVDDLLQLFVRDGKAPMRGSIDFQAHVVWRPGDQSFLKRVALQGNFAIEQAQWEKPERQANVNDLSQRASGGKEKDKKDATAPEVTAEVKGRVELSGGIARFHDTSFTVPGAEATMNGSFNLENSKIDFHGDLKTEASLSKESSGIKAVLLKPLDPLFKRKRAGAVVPVEMTGSYNAPHFGLSLPVKK
jgi:hypothetical protein